MLKAIASMIGRGWPNNLIRLLCAPYCEGKFNDADLDDMIDRAREKWHKPDEEAIEPNADPDADVKRLNTDIRGVADRRQDPGREVRRTG